MAEIALEDVSKIFADGTRAVSAFDLNISDGEFMVLVGPSGCGKSTALRMVAGLEEVSEGTIRIGDRVVNDLPPRDRDVAMVFQNYALYPHLTVYENLAFALKLRKISKQEVERRVKEAASILGLDDLLNRKPRQLSGGQRQRVAMGRAIVRNPQGFLMDEPLSNLDAKLRVQMRAEIARLQNELGVTTIYVTHDQTEAMTMGDRVAVMRKGMLQQVDAPQALYEHPMNLFVAGFIGSPAMNMVEANLVQDDHGMFADFAGFHLRIDDRFLAERPAAKSYAGKQVILGIRPEDMEDVALESDAPQDRRLAAKVDLVEALGSQVLIHFTIAAPLVLTEDTKELASDVGDEALESLHQGAADKTSTFVAQLDPRTSVKEGDQVELAVDASRLHFFDPDTGLGIYAGGGSAGNRS